MKLSRSTVILPLAGLLVIGGAGAVFATSGTPSTGGADTVVPAAESASPDAATGTDTKPRDTVLTDVLTDLVGDGTINESQKTAILDAVTTAREAKRAERLAHRAQIQGFLADGVITQAEFDQLPADSRLRALTDVMADGQITTDELRGLGRGFGGGRGGHGGQGNGPFGGMPDEDAAPSS